jgi:dTDP-glucose 4,6-dehydratase
MKNILVTGGAGFIGSNFIRLILSKYEDVNVANLDLLTYAGNLENLDDVAADKRYAFIHGDIRNRQLADGIFEKYAIDTVVNFAAESHVDRSITEPELFLTTNILGTQCLIDCAKNHWNDNPQDKYSTSYRSGVKYIQISTDEVYGALGRAGRFTEQTPLAPNSPYSASKASADMLVRSYASTYGFPMNITRCSNNYGPYQFPEKLIPLMINNCLNDKPLPVYGDGLQVRDWIYVEDHCSAICSVIESGKPGEIYNVGGNSEKANIEIVRIILKALHKSESLIEYVKDRPGHDRRYAVDNRKIIRDVGWKPAYSFEDGILETLDWYLMHRDWMERVTSEEYRSYYREMYTSVRKAI